MFTPAFASSIQSDLIIEIGSRHSSTLALNEILKARRCT